MRCAIRSTPLNRSIRHPRGRIALLMLPMLVLVGCTAISPAAPTTSGASPRSSTSSSSSCTSEAQPGAASRSVTASGSLGTKPVVSFAKGLDVATTERSIAIAGDGPQAVDGTLVDVALSIFDAKTGATVSEAGYHGMNAAQLTVSSHLYLPGLVKAMRCAPIGSRTITVADSADMFGGNGSPASGVGAGDDLVIVLDLLAEVPTRSTGKPVAPTVGFPKVSFAADGRPTVTIPESAPPSQLKLEVLKKGSGAIVPEGAAVTVQYQGTLWRTKKVFDQSWGSGPTTFATDKVVAGFKKAIVGQAIGSQVLVIVPPADGYGTGGNDTAGIKGTDTLVFVIDILARS